MWLMILAIADKALSLLVSWLPWQLKRADESKKVHDEQQIHMDIAAEKGDFDAWKNARYRRDRA